MQDDPAVSEDLWNRKKIDYFRKKYYFTKKNNI